MKNAKNKILLILFTCLCISCNQKDSNKTDKETSNCEIYKNDKIGWSIQIPKGYSLMSENDVNHEKKKGLEMLEKVYDEKFDTTSVKFLICFQKDKSNIFVSSLRPFEEEYSGKYQKYLNYGQEDLRNAYLKSGFKISSYIGKEIIQGLEFNTLHITFYNKIGIKTSNQIYYNKLINGFDFNIVISCKNDSDKKNIIDAFKNSKFTDSKIKNNLSFNLKI